MKIKFFLLCVLASTSTLSCLENIEQEYKDYAGYQLSNLRNQSWFPSLIYKDAFDLREIHNIDNNNVFGRFRYFDKTKYDSVFLTQRPNISFEVFQQKVQKISNPSKPEWFIDFKKVNSAEFETIIIDNYFLVTRNPKNKEVYFIHTYH